MVLFPKLHRLVLRAFVGPFLAGFSVALFILVLQFLAKYQDEIFGKGFGAWVITRLFAFASIKMVLVALPIGILIASLMTIGRLGERHELAAMKASGISLTRIIRPLILLSVLLAGLSLYTAWKIVPAANLELYSLLHDIKKAKPEFALQRGKFDSKIKHYTIYFADRDPETGMLYDIRIWQHEKNRGNTDLIYADSARMNTNEATMYLTMKLYSGEQHQKMQAKNREKEGEPYAWAEFDSAYTRLDLSGFGLKRTDQSWFKSHRYMMTVAQLQTAVDSLEQVPEKVIGELDKHVKPYAQPKHLLADSMQSWAKQPDGWAADTLAEGGALALLPEDKRINTLGQVKNGLKSIESYMNYIKSRWKREHAERRKYEAELHEKFVLPTACIILLFIGAPMGAIIRRGGLGVPTIIAVGFFILLYLLMTWGEKLAEEGVTRVAVGMWLPVIVMAPMALYLTHQATRDSRLLDLQSWQQSAERILGGIRRWLPPVRKPRA